MLTRWRALQVRAVFTSDSFPANEMNVDVRVQVKSSPNVSPRLARAHALNSPVLPLHPSSLVHSPAAPQPMSPVVQSPTTPAIVSPTSPAIPSPLPTSQSPGTELQIPAFADLSLLSPLVSGSGPHFPGSFRQASAERTLVSGYFTERATNGLDAERRSPAVTHTAPSSSPPPPAAQRSPHVSFATLPDEQPAMEVELDEPLREAKDDSHVPIPVAVDGDVEMADEKPEVQDADEPVQSSAHEDKEPTPPPPPPPPKPKKMSLKDFALRKKRQREEEQRAHVESESPQVESPRQEAEHEPEHEEDEDHEHEHEHEDQKEKEGAQCNANGVGEQEHKAISEEVTTPPGLAITAADELTPLPPTPPPEMKTLEAKVELVDAVMPSPPAPVALPGHAISPRSPTPPPVSPPPPPMSPIPTPSSRNKKENEPTTTLVTSIAASRTPIAHIALTRQLSHEDGEILSPPVAPSKPLPLAPRVHSPPTHPRSFHAHTSPPSRPPRRPLQPAAYRPQIQNIPATATATLGARPLPSGPRALRGANGYASGANNRPLGPGPHHAPRAPSADRDRDRDRVEWDRDGGRPGGWGARGRGAWR